MYTNQYLTTVRLEGCRGALKFFLRKSKMYSPSEVSAKILQIFEGQGSKDEYFDIFLTLEGSVFIPLLCTRVDKKTIPRILA